MTRNDLLMIKGIRRVEEDPYSYSVTLRVSPWWLWSKKRKDRLIDTLNNRMHVGLRYELKAWWW